MEIEMKLVKKYIKGRVEEELRVAKEMLMSHDKGHTRTSIIAGEITAYQKCLSIIEGGFDNHDDLPNIISESDPDKIKREPIPIESAKLYQKVQEINKRTAVIDNPCELCGEEISKPYDFKVCENCYHKSMTER